MKNVLVDSCYWIALFDPQSSPHEEASEAEVLFDLLQDQNIIAPWPTLYEFVNTRLARRRDNLIRFNKAFRGSNVVFLDDSKYKDEAIKVTLEQAQFGFLRKSLVDQVLCEMLSDPFLKIDYFATFNERDFREVCSRQGVEII